MSETETIYKRFFDTLSDSGKEDKEEVSMSSNFKKEILLKKYIPLGHCTILIKYR